MTNFVFSFTCSLLRAFVSYFYTLIYKTEWPERPCNVLFINKMLHSYFQKKLHLWPKQHFPYPD